AIHDSTLLSIIIPPIKIRIDSAPLLPDVLLPSTPCPVLAALWAAVLDPPARARPPAFVADRHQQDVNAAPLAARNQLREDGCQASVAGHVPDVVLARVIVGRLDDELLALRVVGSGGPDRLDVGTMPGLGHGEAPRQLHRHRRPQIALVMSPRAQPADHPPEEPVLHAHLDEQG